MSNRFGLVTFFVVFVLDQVTKHFALTTLADGESVSVLPGFFDFTLVFNKGAAFGLFAGLPDGTRQLALGVVSLIALGVVARMYGESKDDAVSQFALIGIVAGAIGNIVDRIRFGAVVDFLDFYWDTYHWPAFNVADSAICVGVTLLIVRTIFAPNKVSQPA